MVTNDWFEVCCFSSLKFGQGSPTPTYRFHCMAKTQRNILLLSHDLNHLLAFQVDAASQRCNWSDWHQLTRSILVHVDPEHNLHVCVLQYMEMDTFFHVYTMVEKRNFGVKENQ